MLIPLQYSGKEIPDLESNIDNRICDLITLIRKEAASRGAVDVANLAQFFTLDVLTEIAFEKPFGYLTQNQDVHQYIQQVSDFLHMLELCSNFPTIRSIVFSKLMSPFQPKPTDKSGMGAMLGVAKRVVRARYAGESAARQDMLGSFIKNGLSQDEAESEAMLQILGGSDSTATAIRMTFLYILTNPTVYIKLMQEIDGARGRIRAPVITSAEARTLPYLQACIKEGLRIWPPLVGLQGKVSPPEGDTVDGTFIPGGIEVCWCPLSMQHRKDIFGPDADIFRPERWLETAEQDDGGLRLSRMERTLELVFGSGKYGCLGKTVAFIELDKVFVALLQSFEWGLVNPVSPMKTICHGVHVQTDFWVQVRERAQSVL